MKLWLQLVMGTVLLAAPLSAQVPAPAGPQSKPITLTGGIAHVGNGLVIENAVVSFDKGKLTVVATRDAAQVDTANHEILDITGQHVYPGLILPASNLGLTEVGSVNAMRDNSETGSYNPNVRAIVSYNTDSEFIPTLRYNGILLAQTAPNDGVVSGTSSIVQLDAWNWEDAVFEKDDGIYIEWPGRMSRRFDFATFTVQTQPNENYQPIMAELTRLFENAAAYTKAKPGSGVNLKLEAMKGLFDGGKTLFIRADSAKSIIESIDFAKRHGVKKSVLVVGSDAWHVRDFIKKHNVALILEESHRRPDTPEDDVDFPYKLPALLHQEGILFCFAYNGVMGSRNLAFTAGTAAAYGLGKEEALRAMTQNTARILGIDDRVGTLEVGKDATLFVSEGDALDMRSNRLTHAFINGRKITLDAMQQELYHKYKEKYGH